MGVVEPAKKSAKRSPHKVNPYDEKEVAAIKKYFRDNLKSYLTPTTAECKKFLKKHSLYCTPKNIQDREEISTHTLLH